MLNRFISRIFFCLQLLVAIPAFTAYSQDFTNLSFDGQNDFVQFNSHLVPGSGDFTVEFLNCMTVQGQEQALISQGASGTEFHIGITASGELKIGNQITSTVFQSYTWYHLALVKKDTVAKVYVNGTLAATIQGFSIGAGGAFTRLGTDITGNARFAGGFMDEMRIWNRALPPERFTSYNLCSANTAINGLLSLFNFNNGIPMGNNQSLPANVLVNLVNNPLQNGTLINFALNGPTSNWNNLFQSPASGISCQVIYPDFDNDGFGESAAAGFSHTLLANQSTTGGDCNDSINTIFPEALEKCNQIDDDCDGLIEDSVFIPQIFSSSDPAICEGEGIALSNNYTFANYATSAGFIWNDHHPNQISIVVDTAGTFILRDLTTNCTSQPFTVTVLPRPAKPVILPLGPLGICQGEITQLTTVQPAMRYAWSNGETSQVISLAQGATLQLTIFDSGFVCPSPVSDPVTLTSEATILQPSIFTYSPNNICSDQKIELQVNSYSPYQGVYWSNGDSSQTLLAGPGNYSVRIKGYNGCLSVASLNFPVFEKGKPNKPVISIEGHDSNRICTNIPVILAASSGGNYFSWSSGQNGFQQTIQTTQSGKYSVKTFLDGCVSEPSDTLEVFIYPPPPTPLISAAGPLLICNTTPLTLNTVPAQGYVWSTGATTSSIALNSGGTYSVTITDSNGCTASSNPVFVDGVTNGFRSAIIIPSGPTSFCTGDSVTLTATTALGNMEQSWLWNNGATTKTIKAYNSGVYTVVVGFNNGCQSSISNPVTVTASSTPVPPSIYVIGDPSPACYINDFSSMVTLNSSAGTGNLWSNGVSAQQQNVIQTGSYTVTANDPAHCISGTSAPFTLIRSIPPAPLISSSGPLNFCEGDSVVLTCNISGNIFWSNGARTPSITVKSSGYFSVYYFDSLGCVSPPSQTIAVQMFPLPVPPRINRLGMIEACEGQTITLLASGLGSYYWNTGDSTESIVVNASGYFRVRNISTISGCTSNWSDSLGVIFHPKPSKPTLTAFGPPYICSGKTLLVQSSPGYKYRWNDAYLSKSRVLNQAGNYSVVVIDEKGCESPESDTLKITTRSNPPVPVIQEASPVSICAGTAGVSIHSSPSYAYRWNTGATSSSITIKYQGAYNVMAMDSFGCISSPSAYFTLYVNNSPQPPYINTSGGYFCEGDSIQLVSSHPFGNLWSNGDTTAITYIKQSGFLTLTTNDPSSCVQGTVNSFPVTLVPLPPTPFLTAAGPTEFCQGGMVEVNAGQALNYGDFFIWSDGVVSNGPIRFINTDGHLSVRRVISAGIQCKSLPSDSLPIIVHPNPPAPTIQLSTGNFFCQGDSIQLNSSSPNANLWTNGDTTQQITIYQGGTYGVSFKDSNGCSSPIAYQFAYAEPPPDKPTIQVSDSVLCLGESTLLLAITTGNVSDYSWSNVTSGSSWILSVNAEGYYQVTVTSSNGCRSSPSDSVFIKVNPLPTKPVIMTSGPMKQLNGFNYLCDDDSLILNTLIPAQLYKWNFGNLNSFDTIPSLKVKYPPHQPFGSYKFAVTVKDSNGCVSPTSDTLELSGAPRPNAIVGLGPNNRQDFCEGDTIEITANILNQTYLWNNGQTSFSFPVDTSGTFVVTITNSFGCSSKPSAPKTVTRVPNQMLYRDFDFDSYGNPATTLFLCFNPGGWVENYLDCDDFNPNSAIASEYFGDTDGDGFGDASLDTNLCSSQTGFVINDLDCDDASSTVNPDKSELCNNIDDDCDGIMDDSLTIPDISISGSAFICPTGSATLSVNTADHLLWNTGATGPSLTATEGGTYYVTDTLTNCVSSPILLIGCINLKSLETIATSGQTLTGPNVIISYTIGQAFFTHSLSTTGEVREGVQQAAGDHSGTVSLDILVYIEGFYQGGNQPLVEILGPGLTDSITVSLYEAEQPYNLLHSATVILNTSGSASLALPPELSGRSCYISLRQRNTLETWSKTPITLGSSNSLDLTH